VLDVDWADANGPWPGVDARSVESGSPPTGGPADTSGCAERRAGAGVEIGLHASGEATISRSTEPTSARDNTSTGAR
jgi:hypothetical protein